MNENTVSAVCDDAMGGDDAVGIADKIARGKVSIAEITEAAIARAERVNPALNAIVVDRFEQARLEARESQTGVLAGVPTFVKDNSDLIGLPTRYGSRALANSKPVTRNGEFVNQLLSTGVISLGKTTLPEFGIPPTTESLLTGATNNPWNVEHSAGGSSGGAAAMVAAGVVPIAHANDGGGSTRIPAACCGLVGLKPTRGRLVNHDGTEQLPIKVVHDGVVTRSVRDTAAFMAGAEQHFFNRKLPALGAVKTPGSKRLRVGLITGALEGVTVSPDVKKTLNETAQLCEGLGHYVEEIPFPFTQQIADDFIHYYGLLFFSLTRFGKNLIGADFNRREVEQFSHDFGSQFARKMYRLPFVVRRLKQAIKVTEKIYKNYDVVLCPTVSATAPKNGYLFDPNAPSDVIMSRIMDFAPFTALQNITGEPAISLPMGMGADGLPIGMHFSAGFGKDKVLLELAYELEQAQPWPGV